MCVVSRYLFRVVVVVLFSVRVCERKREKCLCECVVLF